MPCPMLAPTVQLGRPSMVDVWVAAFETWVGSNFGARPNVVWRRRPFTPHE